MPVPSHQPEPLQNLTLIVWTAQKRLVRGEWLSAHRYLTGFAVDSVLELFRRHGLLGTDPTADRLDARRRLERVKPDVAAELQRALALPLGLMGGALLGLAEQRVRPVAPDLNWPAVAEVRRWLMEDTSFDAQPVLKGDLVELRPLHEGDYDDLYAVASDPLIWEQHPVRNRHLSDHGFVHRTSLTRVRWFFSTGMKTVISLPDDLFRAAERHARRARKSRSQLYADALTEYLTRHAPDEVTDAMNWAVDRGGEPSPTPFLTRAARRVFERNEW